MSYSGEIPPLSLSFRERRTEEKRREECSASSLFLSPPSLQMSARIDVMSLERALLKCVLCGLFAVQSHRRIVLLWQTLVKIFSGSLSTLDRQMPRRYRISRYPYPFGWQMPNPVLLSSLLLRAPADLPTKNGCTRLPMPLRLQVVITDNYLPRNGSLRGWAALYIPRRQGSFRHAVFPKNIAEFWPVLGYCPHARVQSPLITFRSGHWPCHAKPREEMPFLGCNA